MLRALLLLNAVGCDVRTLERMQEKGAQPEAIHTEGAALCEALGIGEGARGMLAKLSADGWADRELDACAKRGVRVATCRDALYPQGLADLDDAPLLLYFRGNGVPLAAKAVGIVGTRRCSKYAADVSREIGRRAPAHSWTVVSGGARGVDGAAHAGALEAGGQTVAVLGTGVDRVYPAEHRTLFERICEAGALCSEYPLGTGGEGWRFPKRNRIIAGLSQRTVVVEAPHKSGAMITARRAVDAGREVWAVPGRIGDARCEGTNRLIFDGAFPLIDMETFFGEGADPQGTLFDDEPEAGADRAARMADLNDTERTLIALLTNESDRTVDNLAAAAKMSAATVFQAMSLLSLKGWVQASGPGRYRLTD